MRRVILLGVPLVLWGCGADSSNHTSEAVLTSASAAPTPSHQASAAPPASASAVAPASGPRLASCSNGKTKCQKDEVCCRASSDGPGVDYCTPLSAAGEGAPPGSGLEYFAACAQTVPPEAKHQDLSISVTVFRCVDSSDCGADEICALSVVTGDAEGTSCVAKTQLAGFSEVCGRGTCRLGKSTCIPAQHGEGFATCQGTTPIPCGKTTCTAPSACATDGKTARCIDHNQGLAAGAAYDCKSNAQCTEGQVCCVTGDGAIGSNCAFDCNIAMQLPTCTTDADCPKDILGSKPHCKPVGTPGPYPGLKSCQI